MKITSTLVIVLAVVILLAYYAFGKVEQGFNAVDPIDKLQTPPGGGEL